MKINEHVLKLKESATLAINLEAKKLKLSGKEIFHWGFGQSPFPVPSPIQKELANRTAHKEYLPTQGLPALRKTISDFLQKNYQLVVSAENIFIGPGSKELLFQLIYLLDCDFIIPAPSWVSYGPQINLKGRDFEVIPTRFDNKYKLTAKELEEFLKKKPGRYTLILNSPNNPTGQVYTREELRELAKICKEYDLLVLSDEIYGQVCFNSPFAPSISEFYPEKTIITGGLSKAFSAGGYRLGFMTIPDDLQTLIEPFKAMISETFSAVAAPIQYAAIPAFDGNEEVLAEVQLATRIHHKIGQYFTQRLIQMKIDVHTPDGAFYMFPSFDKFENQLQKLGLKDSKDLCNHLLENYQIALLPAQDFYFSGYTTRIAFVDYDGDKIMQLAKAAVVTNKFIEENIPQAKKGLDQLERFIYSLTSLK